MAWWAIAVGHAGSRQALLGRTRLICPTRFLDCAVQLIHLCAALHALCGITQSMSNYCTVQCQFFASNLEKFTPGKKYYTDASLTNIRYAQCIIIITVHHHHHDLASISAQCIIITVQHHHHSASSSPSSSSSQRISIIITNAS